MFHHTNLFFLLNFLAQHFKGSSITKFYFFSPLPIKSYKVIVIIDLVSANISRFNNYHFFLFHSILCPFIQTYFFIQLPIKSYKVIIIIDLVSANIQRFNNYHFLISFNIMSLHTDLFFLFNFLSNLTK